MIPLIDSIGSASQDNFIDVDESAMVARFEGAEDGTVGVNDEMKRLI